MLRCSTPELDRVASENDADIVIAQETGIENSEYRETKNYAIWTASDKEAKERKEIQGLSRLPRYLPGQL